MYGDTFTGSGDWDLDMFGAVILPITPRPLPFIALRGYVGMSFSLGVRNRVPERSLGQNESTTLRLYESRWRPLTSLLLPERVSPSFVCAQDPGKITATTDGNVSTEEKKQSKSQQLKKIFQEYGAVGVSLHIGISLVSLGIFYMVVSR